MEPKLSLVSHLRTVTTMASTASAQGSHVGGPTAPRPNTPNSGSGGSMDELLPLVLQLTNAEQVSCCSSLVVVHFGIGRSFVFHIASFSNHSPFCLSMWSFEYR